jgi:hypothetical protein
LRTIETDHTGVGDDEHQGQRGSVRCRGAGARKHDALARRLVLEIGAALTVPISRAKGVAAATGASRQALSERSRQDAAGVMAEGGKKMLLDRFINERFPASSGLRPMAFVKAGEMRTM